MKLIFKTFFCLFVSVIVSFIVLIIFKPILIADKLYFPYSISKFDIVNKFPDIWLYIKLIYCTNLFITVFLINNSLSKTFNINKIKFINNSKNNRTESNSNFNLLIGLNSENKEKIFIPEKGLYQNILATGTIGSRKN